jgi:phospholipase/carboxylesterase
MPLLDAVETSTGPAPGWSIIWLHGLGADGNDFAPMVPQLVRPGWPAIRFVFPHAPHRAVTINGGMRMPAWYDIRNLDLDQRADEKGVRESIADVEALIFRELERGVPSSRIILAGFSQGGAIALATGLRRVVPLAGLVGLSTYLPMASTTATEATAAAQSTPVFMAHGTLDQVVPESLGALSRDMVRKHGLDVEWHSYPTMAHQVIGQEIATLGNWLQKRFAAG